MDSLKLVNVSKLFNNNVALNKISFTLPNKGIFGLLGTNGAGKTTLIGIILGLIDTTKGDVFVFEKKLSEFRYDILKKLNFTSPYLDLPKKLTVKQNLTFYARLYNVKNFDIIEELSEELKISDLLRKQFGSLSAGQKTKVGLCKALINTPQLLLLDEPTSSLDPETSYIVRNFLKNYQNKNQITIFTASHNMQEVEEICDRVIILDKGKLFVDGIPKDLISKYNFENLEELFLNIRK